MEEWNEVEKKTRKKKMKLNTYQRVYAINNEAGPPLIRPLPILTNNLEERKKKTVVNQNAIENKKKGELLPYPSK